MNVKLTGLILVVTILFFLVVGIDIFINQSRSLKKFELQEPPDSVKSKISREVELCATRRPVRGGDAHPHE